MKFKNDTGKEAQIRIDDGQGSYMWKIIDPGTSIELPEAYGLNLGFTKESEIKAVESQVKDQKVETKVLEPEFKIQAPEPGFAAELNKIRNLGQNTINDILGVFPTKAKLKEAIKSGIELPFNRKIDKILRDNYGK